MRTVAMALAILSAAVVADAQKILVPTQSANKSVVITPAPQAEQDLAKAKRITREEAVKLVKSGKAVFVDVRSKESYDFGHVKGALSIPESTLVTRLKEIPPHKMIITYCA